jgi:GrpB-like predicted nucleotidyltransferase (UPF0157 family)
MATMELVFFVPASTIAADVNPLVDQETRRITHLLPNADVHHIGSTAIPKALTKGDVDLNVRVSPERFHLAVSVLRCLYGVNQPENWSDNFASFKEDDSFPLKLGVQLTVRGSSDDFFLAIRDLFLEDGELVKEYDDLKRSFDGKSTDAYWAAKTVFLTRLLQRRVP